MDKNEQKLTEAEKRRLEHFEKTSEEMVRQGYVRQDLTVDIRKANRFGTRCSSSGTDCTI